MPSAVGAYSLSRRVALGNGNVVSDREEDSLAPAIGAGVNNVSLLLGGFDGFYTHNISAER